MPDTLLNESRYVDFKTNVIMKADSLYSTSVSQSDYTEKAFLFVRDNINHAFDINAKIITAKASEVFEHRVGICHAKAALLVALLRLKGIPAGFQLQKLTLADDASCGYCIHGYCAAYLNGAWVEMDARGNQAGINAQFSIDKPLLAFEPREKYGEFTYLGIYAEPHLETMQLLEHAPNIEYVYNNMPVTVSQIPITGA